MVKRLKAQPVREENEPESTETEKRTTKKPKKDVKTLTSKGTKLDVTGKKKRKTGAEESKKKQVSSVETEDKPKRKKWKWSDLVRSEGGKRKSRPGKQARNRSKIQEYKANRQEFRIKAWKKSKFFELIMEAKVLWKQIKAAPKDSDKEPLLLQLNELFKDRPLKEYVLEPGTCRFIEFLVRSGNAEIQQRIFDDIKEYIWLLSKNGRGHHLIKAFLNQGTPEQKQEIVSELMNYVNESEQNENFYSVLNCGRHLITDKEKRQLRNSAYGPIFAVFRSSDTETLSEFFERMPNHKTRVLKDVEEFLVKCLESNTMNTFIFQDVFVEYLELREGSDDEKCSKKLLEAIKKNVDGLCSAEKSGVIVTVLEHFDVGRLNAEGILELVLSRAVQLTKTASGMEVLQKLVFSAERVGNHDIDSGEEEEESPNSSILDAVSLVLLKLLAGQFDRIVSVPHPGGFDLALAILLRCAGDKKDAYAKVCKFFAKEKMYRRLRGCFEFLQQIVMDDTKKFKKGITQDLFSESLMRAVDVDCIKNWAGLSGGTELIKTLYHSKIPSVVKKTKEVLVKLGGQESILMRTEEDEEDSS